MASRTTCSFHRIGVVLAVLALLGSSWLAMSERNWQADTEAAQARALASLSNAELQKMTAGTRMSTAVPEVHHANYTTVFVLLALALALYAAARAGG